MYQKILRLIFIALGTILFCALWRMPIQTKAAPTPLHALKKGKKGYEVFGFAPYWTMDKLQNIDFTVLSTLAYFSVDVLPDGSLDTSGTGFASFESQNATDLFTKAHENGTRVVLTLTQMDSENIISFLDNPQAQQNAITHIVSIVQTRGIDGVNVDFEYIGNPGSAYREKYAAFIATLDRTMHQAVPSSKVSVSVLATAARDQTLYDVSTLAKASDEIFLMAYDFGNISSTNAMPTSPMYGYKNGTYWYDVSTAVDDFLTQMPRGKLVMGVPWYSYNYAVSSPQINAATINTSNLSQVQTYATASADTIQATGWDSQGDVGWKAYFDAYASVWRMIFIDDPHSLGIKYDFAKDNHLAGVGIWALGFDNGTHDMWVTLRDKFGIKIADTHVFARAIQN